MSEASVFEEGVKTILHTAKTLPNKPGVYRMINTQGTVLYVGKAKNLKKRVVSYTQIQRLPNRLQRMVSETHSIEIVITTSETEALLLESNLVKKLQPYYNVLLKDDKSFPYILLTDHEFPRILKYRGSKTEKGSYFGPFANVAAVNEAIITIQRLFYIRNCTDTFFKNRIRPCLQYDIKRCTAPCVGKINSLEYQEFIETAKAFLLGKNDDVQKKFAQKMQQASDVLNFEKAAKCRDSIRLLTQIQEKQRIHVNGLENADIFALAKLHDQYCVQGFFFRNGRNYGTETFQLNHTEGIEPKELISAFLNQFYVDHEPAKIILCNIGPSNQDTFINSLKQKYNITCFLEVPKKGQKADLVADAFKNAQIFLERSLMADLATKKQFIQLQEFLGIEVPPKTIEVYDNSHLHGTSPYGVCIAVHEKGFDKNRYRKFSLNNTTADTRNDIAMMQEVIKRRVSHKNEWPLPDIFLIDGGALQVSAAYSVLKELDINIPVVGIAKGEKRNSGDETFYFIDGSSKKLPANSSLLYFLEKIRDEAHRFAIGAHKAGRKKQLIKSTLDSIPGIGAKRKKILLQHFGSSSAVSKASVQELMIVSGINKSVAEKIYYFFHQD